MAAKYFAILTNLGAAKLANATALGTQLEITHMAVGDGGGGLPIPNPAQTALIGERRRAAINLLTIDPLNNSQIISEQVIPEDVGGWWIREVGLFDKDGSLVAIANCPETYKPQLQEGSGRTQTIRVILIVSSTQSVSLKIDPSVVLATRKYVDDNVIEVRAYADQLMESHVADDHPHKQYAKVANAPETLNDLGKVAAAINNDPNFYANIIRMLPVGIPQPWPQATPPTGWLKCNGAAFDKARYPKLAQAYPSGVLPDLRGEFIRGWDDGRGIDVGRALLSTQNATKLPSIYVNAVSATQGTLVTPAVSGFSGQYPSDNRAKDFEDEVKSSSSPYLTTTPLAAGGLVNEVSFRVRPRSMAFNMIVMGA
ncbi:phage tail protein [Plesiomonas shigelloides]|uniref:phage tail protein n=1 Tax=Plesiomonas shigelloides TaxID=703 RepID=UPI0012620027|nr:phage tail protein [Plesiomonas shigelloides]KAB7666336.1 phage tail protein [Plesiomonas shigelloides]